MKILRISPIMLCEYPPKIGLLNQIKFLKFTLNNQSEMNDVPPKRPPSCFQAWERRITHKK